MDKNAFVISALVDFPDDCGGIAFTPELVEQLIDRLQWMGARRVYWNHYSEEAWTRFNESRLAAGSTATQETLDNLGDPMLVGRRRAHERGMEFYATVKPYETGGSRASPAGSAETEYNPGLPCIGGMHASVQSWVMRRPEMRVRARTADLPGDLSATPITRIQLRQRDMAPIRIGPENLQVWTSADNNGYQQREVSFQVREGVDTCPRDVIDLHGEQVTSEGAQVRVLDITGLNLLDPFIAITTDFDDEGSFHNTTAEMVRAFGPDGAPVPIVVASQKAVWRPERDFRTGDLQFDGGIGDIAICLDVSNQSATFSGWQGSGSGTRDGVIALARGRNEHVSGSLCEAYPEVQEHWLDQVGECIAAGVDGVDVRISCHSCWTNTPDIYGFNEPVTAEYQRRYGVNPDVEPYDPELLGALRGEFFDRYLRSAKSRLSAAGKPMQLHFESESFRSDTNQGRWRTRPGNITFNWRGWLRSGLADEGTLFGRGWTPPRILDDAVAQDMIGEANAAGVPMHMNKQVSANGKEQADWLELSYRNGGFSGYTFYETASMFENILGPDGMLQFRPGLIEAIRERVESLGLME